MEPAGALSAGGDPTIIGRASYRGSVRQVNPVTEACLRQTGPPCAVMGTPPLDGAGIGMLAAGTPAAPRAPPGAYLINAAAGAILKTLPVGGSRVFSQPVVAQGHPLRRHANTGPVQLRIDPGCAVRALTPGGP